MSKKKKQKKKLRPSVHAWLLSRGWEYVPTKGLFAMYIPPLSDLLGYDFFREDTYTQCEAVRAQLRHDDECGRIFNRRVDSLLDSLLSHRLNRKEFVDQVAALTRDIAVTVMPVPDEAIDLLENKKPKPGYK